MVVDVWGADRVGVRLNPFSDANNISDSDPQATFSHAIKLLNSYGWAYLHLVEGQTGGPRDISEGGDLKALYELFDGAKMGNNAYDHEMAIESVETGAVDLVAFGRPFISNPDLVSRLEKDASLNEQDATTLYGGNEKGYIDYPALEEEAVAVE